MFTWWKPSACDRSSSPARRRYRPHLEALEARETPAASLLLGPTVNVSQAFHNQREQSIVVNPKNPNEVVAFSNIEDIDGDNVADDGIFSAFSTNGGLTWSTQYLFTDPAAPEAGGGDPQATWDRFGNLFLTYLTSGGDIAVALSVDSGRSFRVNVITTDGNPHDQPSIAVGPGPHPGLGSIWVSYQTASTTPLFRGIETQVAVVAGFGLVGSFYDPVQVPGSDQALGNFGDIAVGPFGQVMVTYHSQSAPAAGPSQIWVNVDPDGMGPLPFGPRTLVTATNVGGARLIPGTSNSLGIDAEPNLDWDRSQGPFRNRVYLVYSDAASTTTNDIEIVLRYSDNNGLSWSAPVRVSDTSAGSQFNPAIAVDNLTGFIGLGWYDTRNDGAGIRAEFFATVSNDGGKTFAPNIRASLGASQSLLAEPPAGGVRPLGYGDYNKIDFVNGNLQLVWADNSPQLPGNPSPGRMDIAAARIRVGKPFAVRVYFPVRWRLIDAAAGVYQGRLTVVNNTKFPIGGPFTLSITLKHPSMKFIFPANTQSGNTFTFTINQTLRRKQPLRFVVQLSNPLKLRLPTSVIGFATSLGN
jgi:hypothetical protein